MRFQIVGQPGRVTQDVEADNPEKCVEIIVRAWAITDRDIVQVRQEASEIIAPLVCAVVYPHIVVRCLVASYCTGKLATYQVSSYKSDGNDYLLLDDTNVSHPRIPVPGV